MMLPSFFEWFECERVATKSANYAVMRNAALKELGFVLSEDALISSDKTRKYYDYWVKRNDEA